jgi:hypothetical protein
MPGPTQEACPYFLVEMKLVSVGAWLYLTALENETSFGILRIPRRQTINQNLDQMDGFRLAAAIQACFADSDSIRVNAT